MAYIKKWDPPMAMVYNNLAAWKAICLDIHQNILDAGLVQTSTPGQLNISAVGAIPAENTYAGFIEYAFGSGDPLQSTLPVVMKMEYGLGRAGLNSSTSIGYQANKIIRLRPTFIVGTAEYLVQAMPQSYGSTGSSNITQNIGKSFLFYDEVGGRFSLLYSVGGVIAGSDPVQPGTYRGAISNITFERTRTSNVPDGRGIIVLTNGLTTAITTSNWQAGAMYGENTTILSYFLSPTEQIGPYRDYGIRPGLTNIHYIGTDVQVHNIYAATPYIEPFTCIKSYVHTQIPFEAEFDVAVGPGDTRNFVALGNETGMFVDRLSGNTVSLAMEFE